MTETQAQTAAAPPEEFWTAERITILCKRWAEGALIFDIAEELACGCTRNMVIGKARRLKLGPATPNKERIRARLSQAQRLRFRNQRAKSNDVSRETAEAAA